MKNRAKLSGLGEVDTAIVYEEGGSIRVAAVMLVADRVSRDRKSALSSMLPLRYLSMRSNAVRCSSQQTWKKDVLAQGRKDLVHAESRKLTEADDLVEVLVIQGDPSATRIV